MVTTFQQVHVLEHGTEARPLQLTGVVERVVVEGITEVEEPLEVVPPESPLGACVPMLVSIRAFNLSYPCYLFILCIST